MCACCKPRLRAVTGHRQNIEAVKSSQWPETTQQQQTCACARTHTQRTIMCKTVATTNTDHVLHTSAGPRTHTHMLVRWDDSIMLAGKAGCACYHPSVHPLRPLTPLAAPCLTDSSSECECAQSTHRCLRS